jgi:hypothetical protein
MQKRSLAVLASVVVGLIGTRAGAAGSLNGSGGDMPAYYDGVLHTINFKQLKDQPASAIHEHNKSFNTIYQCDACAGQIDGGDFVSVLDAIQGDGFNPLWEEFQIAFTAGNTPHQFVSDNEVLAAFGRGEITLTDTDEIYRCSVVGAK